MYIKTYQDIDVLKVLCVRGFNIFIKLAGIAGQTQRLEYAKDITVFAPSDRAFKKLDKNFLNEIIMPENQEILSRLILYHIIPCEMDLETLIAFDDVETMSRQKIQISRTGARVFVDDSEILENDITAKNGVIHIIDKVLTYEKEWLKF
jgi:uncharacterized surface protein with fasciclin (FAS1) repeats